MKVAIIDGIAAHYRLLLFQKLSQQTETEYHLFASGSKYQGIETIDPRLASVPVINGGIKWDLIENITFLKRIVWQRQVLSLARKSNFDVYIFIGEAQVLSTWIGALICRIRERKVAFWGHGIYGNEGFFKKNLRRIFNKLPDTYMVYNERAKELLLKDGIRKEKIFVVNNSLNHDAHLIIRNSIRKDELIILKNKLFPLNNRLPVLIFIGRLTNIKKIDQVIRAMEILHSQGKKVNCLIIGKGEMENSLKEFVTRKKLDEYFHFYGPCYDERENALMLSMSDCCISPGNAGLLAIHSMSFGTPVITHNDFPNQMPESDTIIENRTGEFFEKDNLYDLADKIDKLVFVNGKEHYSSNCLTLMDNYYNPDYQIRIFNDMMRYLGTNTHD